MDGPYVDYPLEVQITVTLRRCTHCMTTAMEHSDEHD